jgi:hypothetical protein
MKSVNRTAVIVKPKQPFVDWLNSILNDKSDYTLDKVSAQNLVFLIPEYDYPQQSMDYIKKVYAHIFEFELFGWYTDEELWPEKRSWKMFQEWFSIEINSEVFDLVDGTIEKEDM